MDMPKEEPPLTYWQRSVNELKTKTLWRDVFAEFLGTFFLVAAQCSLLGNWSSRSQGGAPMNGLGMGFVVIMLATTVGDFSGAQLNPAVTIPFILARRTPILRGILYIIVQVIAGILGAGFLYLMTPASLREGLGVTTHGNGVSSWQAMCIEAWITCTLVLTILASTNSRRKLPSFMAPLPIGFAVGLGLLIGYGYTGGSMNPARSFGPAVIHNVWLDHWVYWAGPIGGGLLAMLFYSVILDPVERPLHDMTLTVVCRDCDHVNQAAPALGHASHQPAPPAVVVHDTYYQHDTTTFPYNYAPAHDDNIEESIVHPYNKTGYYATPAAKMNGLRTYQPQIIPPHMVTMHNKLLLESTHL